MRFFPGTAQRLVPGLAAELVPGRLVWVGAGIAADARQVGHRGVEFVATGVLQCEELHGAVTDIQGL